MNLNIRSLLTVQFTVIVAFILILFSLSIYYFSSTYRENQFDERLRNQAVSTAKLLIEVNEVGPELLKIINKTGNVLYNEHVVIYDFRNKVLYNSSDLGKLIPEVNEVMLDKIRLEKEVKFSSGEKECLGILYTDRYDRFVSIVSGLDMYGKGKLNNLKWILIFGFFISTGITIILGRIYSNRALKPMSDVVKQVDNITISSLNTRVNEGNGTDEIAQLAITFNKMLERLDSAFQMQRSFVSNASHELRTPLTSITGQIEVSLLKNRPAEDYKQTLYSVLEDIKNLNSMTNGLLDLAKASSDVAGIVMQKLRVDEMLWSVREYLIQRNPEYNVQIIFDESIEDESLLSVNGNEHLLKTAILNLMENACKYSTDHTVEIMLTYKTKHIAINFKDHGIGIEESEIQKVTQPFYRAENAMNIPGNGLGLPLTMKIIEVHGGRMNLTSVLNKGTEITLFLRSA
ncbi:MAG: HAMP domain-containing histidine kinase [Flavobacteriales bacterium]|nr:HAMP domain-containing histidine kinase [Flavobacteriales bacterium]